MRLSVYVFAEEKCPCVRVLRGKHCYHAQFHLQRQGWHHLYYQRSFWETQTLDLYKDLANKPLPTLLQEKANKKVFGGMGIWPI